MSTTIKYKSDAWMQREAEECQALIERNEQRLKTSDLKGQTAKELYLDICHTRRWLRWYKAKNKRYFVAE